LQADLGLTSSDIDPTRAPEERGRGDFDSDWAGRALLERYLSGGGDLTIADDPAWSEYMKANRQIRVRCTEHVRQLAAQVLSSGEPFSDVDDRFHMEIQNGEGMIGYQYLHGTNGAVGDFGITGTAQVTCGAKGNRIQFELTYTWNDIIDPNPEYSTDLAKSGLAEAATLGMASAYRLQISWRESCLIEMGEEGEMYAFSGWPRT
jgi:hypothetical protein